MSGYLKFVGIPREGSGDGHHPPAELCSAGKLRTVFGAALPPGLDELIDGEKPMKRTASAVWSGGLKDGKGSISTQSGILDNTQYGFSTRFENGSGTNPEELIAAAHAGCFSMALSAQLGEAGMTAESIRTSAVVTLEKDAGGFSITAVDLDLVAKIPGADPQAFETAANNAKNGCPVSKVLNAKITLHAKLEG
jgi:osmotically inducible protein OsmC